MVTDQLEPEIQVESDWSPDFFDRLSKVDVDTARDIDDLVAAIRAGRSASPPRDG